MIPMSSSPSSPAHCCYNNISIIVQLELSPPISNLEKEKCDLFAKLDFVVECLHLDGNIL